MPTMQYDVLAAWNPTNVASANAGNMQMITGRWRMKEIAYVGGGSTSGSITIYDTASGTATGRIVWSTNFHTANVPNAVNLAGEGILLYNGAYVVVTNVVGLTICYG